MTDPLRFLDDLLEGLGDASFPGFPGFPDQFPGEGKSQPTDFVDISRISRISRSENGGSGDFQSGSEENEEDDFSSRDGVARRGSYQKSPGNPGNPGNNEKTLAETTLYHFPVLSLLPGKNEREPGNEACRHPVLDRTGPQRSDWWDGAAMAEVDALCATPSPISPDIVRAGVARELRALAALGVTGPEAERRAVEITRVKIANSDLLAERQVHAMACHVCENPLDDDAPMIAVLSGKPGAPLFMHADCHDAYRARRAALVDRIMAAAGYATLQRRNKPS